MRRREFIAGLGSATAWPLAARAQQPPPVRRIGVLMGFSENDPQITGLLSGFTLGLAELGWTDGRDLRMNVRWAAGDVDRMRTFARELVRQEPDAILAVTTPVAIALHRETRTIPIIFVLVSDPIGAGLVASLPRPGGNFTGFISEEASMAGKWVQLLTEIAPHLKRTAIMFNPDTAPGGGSYHLSSFEAAAQLSKLQPVAAAVRSEVEIEMAIASLGREQQGGLVVIPDSFMAVNRALIISLTVRDKVPTVFWNSYSVRDGGLLSYGTDLKNEFHRGAVYVDRILRGDKPANLPVQQPVKFELAVNLETAKALGLTVPQAILLRADEVIE
jgi:putative ABC transport system substrate-binding protein